MTQDKSKNARPVCILISALGGEGGGVLKDWVVHTAHAAGYPVQATSIPGVAQRTGATTYYVEVFPVKRVDIKDRWPVLCLSPTAGQVDFFVGSMLSEMPRIAASVSVADFLAPSVKLSMPCKPTSSVSLSMVNEPA